jgi:hypothetical protein
MRALIAFPKCFFGMLAAAALQYCEYLAVPEYMPDSVRDSVVRDFVRNTTQGVAGTCA